MADEEETRDEFLQKLASEPKQVTGDQGSYTAHSLPDQIAFDKHLGAKQPGANILRQIYVGRYRPPSARG